MSSKIFLSGTYTIGNGVNQSQTVTVNGEFLLRKFTEYGGGTRYGVILYGQQEEGGLLPAWNNNLTNLQGYYNAYGYALVFPGITSADATIGKGDELEFEVYWITTKIAGDPSNVSATANLNIYKINGTPHPDDQTRYAYYVNEALSTTDGISTYGATVGYGSQSTQGVIARTNLEFSLSINSQTSFTVKAPKDCSIDVTVYSSEGESLPTTVAGGTEQLFIVSTAVKFGVHSFHKNNKAFDTWTINGEDADLGGNPSEYIEVQQGATISCTLKERVLPDYRIKGWVSGKLDRWLGDETNQAVRVEVVDCIVPTNKYNCGKVTYPDGARKIVEGIQLADFKLHLLFDPDAEHPEFASPTHESFWLFIEVGEYTYDAPGTIEVGAMNGRYENSGSTYRFYNKSTMEGDTIHYKGEVVWDTDVGGEILEFDFVLTKESGFTVIAPKGCEVRVLGEIEPGVECRTTIGEDSSEAIDYLPWGSSVNLTHTVREPYTFVRWIKNRNPIESPVEISKYDVIRAEVSGRETPDYRIKGWVSGKLDRWLGDETNQAVRVEVVDCIVPTNKYNCGKVTYPDGARKIVEGIQLADFKLHLLFDPDAEYPEFASPTHESFWLFTEVGEYTYDAPGTIEVGAMNGRYENSSSDYRFYNKSTMEGDTIHYKGEVVWDTDVGGEMLEFDFVITKESGFTVIAPTDCGIVVDGVVMLGNTSRAFPVPEDSTVEVKASEPYELGSVTKNRKAIDSTVPIEISKYDVLRCESNLAFMRYVIASFIKSDPTARAVGEGVVIDEDVAFQAFVVSSDRTRPYYGFRIAEGVSIVFPELLSLNQAWDGSVEQPYYVCVDASSGGFIIPVDVLYTWVPENYSDADGYHYAGYFDISAKNRIAIDVVVKSSASIRVEVDEGTTVSVIEGEKETMVASTQLVHLTKPTTEVTLKVLAIPEGKEFVAWYLNGEYISSQEEHKDTVSNGSIIKCEVLQKRTVKVKVTAPTGHNVTAAFYCDGTYIEEKTVTGGTSKEFVLPTVEGRGLYASLRAWDDDEERFNGWLLNNVLVDKWSNPTIIHLEGDSTITCSFGEANLDVYPLLGKLLCDRYGHLIYVKRLVSYWTANIEVEAHFYPSDKGVSHNVECEISTVGSTEKPERKPGVPSNYSRTKKLKMVSRIGSEGNDGKLIYSDRLEVDKNSLIHVSLQCDEPAHLYSLVVKVNGKEIFSEDYLSGPFDRVFGVSTT